MQAIQLPKLINSIFCEYLSYEVSFLVLTTCSSLSVEDDELPEDLQLWGSYFGDQDNKAVLKSFERLFAQYGNALLGKYIVCLPWHCSY